MDAADAPATLIRCRALRVGYRDRALLPPLDATVGAGQIWAVLGRNGTGKTTLFRTLLGLIPPVGGTIERDPKLTLAYAPQRAALDPLFPALAVEVVAMGRERGWSFARPAVPVHDAAMEALERVGAAELARRPFRELSEGQKQRVLLARILVAPPSLAVLDEPTSAMDEVAERAALAHLEWLRREHGTTVLVVAHHLGLMRDVSDHAILLDSGCDEIVVGATDEVVRHAIYEHNFGGLRATHREVD